MCAATGGRDACPPLRFAAFWARPLAWRARANRAPGRRQQNSSSTIGNLSMHHVPKRPATRLASLPALTVCLWAPASPRYQSWKGRSGTARVKGACGVPPGSPTLDPHRTEPEVGSYRGDAGGLPARLTRNRQRSAVGYLGGHLKASHELLRVPELSRRLAERGRCVL